MPYKPPGAMSGRGDNRGQNGNRGNFRTDAAISNSRFGAERVLKRWEPDSTDPLDGGLESSGSGGHWDQFAENERRFGIKTDYDESIYTTTIDKSHPQYRQRMAAAERKAKEIEGSQATTAHVAEERVMDYVGGEETAENEEDKYSGVRRQDFPPLGARENKYTPPAKRAPAAQATVSGAPIDPAIISSQVKTTNKKPNSDKPEENKSDASSASKPAAASAAQDATKAAASTPPVKQTAKDETAKPQDAVQSGPSKADNGKSADKSGSSSIRPSGSSSRAVTPQTKEGAPSATSTVERDVLQSFKSFATIQRQTADKMRTTKAKADKEVKLTELKKFATSFKLSTPVPNDLISIIAKDPSKQKEIQQKAMRNAEDIASGKAGTPAATKEKDQTPKDAGGKSGAGQQASQGTATQAGGRPGPSQFASSPGAAMSNRHPNSRQSYAGPGHHNQQYRGAQQQQQHAGQQNRAPLGQRLRNVEQQKMSHPPAQPHTTVPEMRVPPTGPANPNSDSGFGRRMGAAPNHQAAKLNPNSHEFRPNPFATSFNPNGAFPSAGSSPRSAAAANNNSSNNNNTQEASSSTQATTPGQLIRRKTKAIDAKKCNILAHAMSAKPPQGRNWDDNDGLRPSYDTLPTWRQMQDEESEKPDSTMRLSYKEFLERQSFATPTMTASNQPPGTSNLPHHYQLPLHMQQGPQGMGPRQSPNMPPMPLHGQHAHGPHAPYNMDEHRMMHSNSAQSFSSPRMSQTVPMNYGPAANSPAQNPYNQPMMQPYGGPGTPQMGQQMRNFSNNQQYMPHQPGHMGAPMMMNPQFMNTQGMVPNPQMPMYGGHAQFAPPGGGPPQPMMPANGYPSPGRPSAPMMAHQGSQQGQPVYGMSPNVQYQQPAFTPQQPGAQGGRGYNSPGNQHYGSSPQQPPHFNGQHRNGNNYGGKNFGNHGQQQQQQQQQPAVTQQNSAAPAAATPNRGTENSSDSK